ncbi:MAG TPA: carbonic anhydrase [Solirubrobacteraceae bacterium]|nr:carbonic anhydrase [Solirubrobacteraceae bacterium]
MSFSWEPFGRTRQEDPPAPAAPSAPPPAEPEPARAAALPFRPARGLAVLMCMDCRIDPLSALGLSLGDAVVLRNAGATVSDDVLRSLQLAHEALGVRAVHVIAHTDCAAHGRDDEAAAAEAEYGAERISAVLPDMRVSSGILDLATGTVL